MTELKLILYCVKFMLPSTGMTYERYVAARSLQDVVDKFEKDFTDPVVLEIKRISEVHVV